MSEGGRHFCENCGTGMRQTANFCPSCGTAQHPDLEEPTGPPALTPEPRRIPTSDVPNVPPPRPEDGQPVVLPGGPLRAEGEIEVGRPPGWKQGTPLDAPLVMNVGGVQLAPGGYVWELEMDGDKGQEPVPSVKSRLRRESMVTIVRGEPYTVRSSL